MTSSEVTTAYKENESGGSVPQRLEGEPGSITFDTGPRAFATLIGGFCASFVTFGYVNAFGVYQDFYTRSAVASPSTISWVGSTQLFFMFAMGLVGGKFLDLGYFRQTLFVGSVIYTVCLFMLSLVHLDKYYQIYLSQGLGMGIGGGLIYIPTLAIQSHHWRRHRALALGVVSTGSSFGGVIFPIMLNRLINGSVGFAWGVRASAFLVLGLLVIANVLMTPNKAISSSKAEKPDIKGVLTDTSFTLASFAVLIISWGLFLPYFYLQLFAILHGVDSGIAFYMIAILNAAAIPGKVTPGIFADRYGSFNALIPCTIASGILIFALFGVKSVASTIIFAILFGFFSGAFLALCTPVVASLCRHPNEAGLRLGISFFVGAFGVLTGTPIEGALLGEAFEWFKPITFGGITVVFGAALLFIARHIFAMRKNTFRRLHGGACSDENSAY